MSGNNTSQIELLAYLRNIMIIFYYQNFLTFLAFSSSIEAGGVKYKISANTKRISAYALMRFVKIFTISILENPDKPPRWFDIRRAEAT